MSNHDPGNIDHERYFNDPEYRKMILDAKKKAEEEQHEPTDIPVAKPKDRLGRKIVMGFAVFILVGMIGASIYTYFLFQGLPSIEQLENPETAIATEVRSRDGQVLDKYFTENRTWVRYDERELQNAENKLRKL